MPLQSGVPGSFLPFMYTKNCTEKGPGFCGPLKHISSTLFGIETCGTESVFSMRGGHILSTLRS